MRYIEVIGCLLLLSIAGSAGAESTQSEPEAVCADLLERGDRLTSIDDPDISALGVEKLREAVEVCGSAVTYQGLSQVQSGEQYLAEAQRYAEEAMDRARRVLGLRDGTTMTAAAVLRSVLSKRGFAERAEALEQEIAPYVDLEDPLDF